MLRVKKIIVHRDGPNGYSSTSYIHDIEVDYPYVAGITGYLVNEQAKLIDSQSYNVGLFNDSGLARLALPVGPKGVYYLILRANHSLKQLTFDPIEVVPDIFLNFDFNKKTQNWDVPNDRLLYSFYNPTRRQSISISCKLDEDTENIYSKILANPDDLYWRQYFIKNAMMESIDQREFIRSVRDLMNQDQLADYLQVSKKTIQNWTAAGTIPIEKIVGTKEIRYRKTDIDAILKTKQVIYKRKK